MPIEIQHPPYWLTGQAVDELQGGERLEAFTVLHEGFLHAFEKEEKLMSLNRHSGLNHTNIMRTGWKIGKLWYFHALDSPKGIYNLLLQHIQPRFAQPHNDTELNRIVAPYWAPNADQVIALKIKDNEVYTDELRKAFGTDKYGEETYDG